MRKLNIVWVIAVVIFMNWFSIILIDLYGSMLAKHEVTWLLGLFSGLIVLTTIYEIAIEQNIEQKNNEKDGTK